MRICAEFENEDNALEAHKAVVDAGVPPDSIEVRSAYPLPEEVLPPSRSHPMRMRNLVRICWVLGGVVGFGFVAYTQLIWPIHTSGFDLVSFPIDFIPTYECCMVGGLISTLLFFYWETRRYRKLNPPVQEDKPVEIGNIAIVVDGEGAEKARDILKLKGAKSLVTYALIFLLFTLFMSGCAVKMVNEPYKLPTAHAAVPQPEGTISMPTEGQQKYFVKPLGWKIPHDAFRIDKKSLGSGGFPKSAAAFITVKNPVPPTSSNIARGKTLFLQNCAFCHGTQGKGNGPVGNVFMPHPPNLARKKLGNVPVEDPVKLTDGQLFYYLTMGPGTMPSFATRLTNKERFEIIDFLRSLQKKQETQKK